MYLHLLIFFCYSAYQIKDWKNYAYKIIKIKVSWESSEAEIGKVLILTPSDTSQSYSYKKLCVAILNIFVLKWPENPLWIQFAWYLTFASAISASSFVITSPSGRLNYFIGSPDVINSLSCVRTCVRASVRSGPRA